MPYIPGGRLFALKFLQKYLNQTLEALESFLPFVNQPADFDGGICFVLPGTSMNLTVDGGKHKNIIFLLQISSFYHPDLVNAPDVVIGKIGYSTLADVYHAGVPYGYIPRSDFWESAVCELYIQSNMEDIRMDVNNNSIGI